MAVSPYTSSDMSTDYTTHGDTDGFSQQDILIDPPWFIGGSLIAVTIFGMSGSGIIIYMFLFRPKLRNPSNLFIVNLAVSDAVYLICHVQVIHSVLAHGGRRSYGHIECLVNALLVIDSGGTSLLTMGLIAVSRYVAIVHPQKKALLSWKVCAALCVYPWIHVILLMVPGLTGWGRLGWHKASWACTFDWNYNIWYNVVIFIFTQGVTSTTMLFCYSQIYMVYKKSKKRVAGKDMGQKGPQKEDIRLAIQLVVIFAIYNICWTPYFTITVFIYPDGDGPPWLHALMILFIAWNSAVNILVYLYFNRTFRRECLETIGMKSLDDVSTATASTSVSLSTSKK